MGKAALLGVSPKGQERKEEVAPCLGRSDGWSCYSSSSLCSSFLEPGKSHSSVRDWAKPLRDLRRAFMKPTPLMLRRRRLSPRPRSHHRWRRDSLLNRGRLSTSNRSSKGDGRETLCVRREAGEQGPRTTFRASRMTNHVRIRCRRNTHHSGHRVFAVRSETAARGRTTSRQSGERFQGNGGRLAQVC